MVTRAAGFAAALTELSRKLPALRAGLPQIAATGPCRAWL
jgi:hypothetical protein